MNTTLSASAMGRDGLQPPDICPQASFRDAMRHQAATVAIIATGNAGHRSGLTATAVCSLSDDPPSLLVCVNRNASAHGPILASGWFSVNFLGQSHCDIARTFSSKIVRGDQRFADERWIAGRTGVPVLADAAASLECRLGDQRVFGSHSILVGLVEASRALQDSAPLVYHMANYVRIADPIGSAIC